MVRSRKSMARGRWSGVAAVVVFLTMAACSAGSVAEAPGSADLASFPSLAGGEPSLDPRIVAAGDPKSVALPLAAYLWDDAAVRIVNRARILVGDRCMRRYGFAPLPWTPEGEFPMVSWSRYGLWDEDARKFGYQGPASNDNSYPVRFMGADPSLVYFGETKEYKGISVPDGGCQGQEFAEVFAAAGVSFADLTYLSDLDQESRARARQDRRVVGLLDDWKSCMKSAGWSYADVLAPFAYWATRRGPDKARPVVSDEEMRSVADDLECKRKTRLLGTWLGAEVAYQNAIIERDGERLREFRQHLDAVLATANKILANG